MSNIVLRFMTVVLVTIALTACGNKEGSQTTVASAATPPSGENEFVEANDENCNKISSISTGYSEAVGRILNTSAASINYIRVVCNSKSGIPNYVVVDTPSGPKNCIVPGVLWLKSGVYVASEYFKTSDGKVFNGIGNSFACNFN